MSTTRVAGLQSFTIYRDRGRQSLVLTYQNKLGTATTFSAVDFTAGTTTGKLRFYDLDTGDEVTAFQKLTTTATDVNTTPGSDGEVEWIWESDFAPGGIYATGTHKLRVVTEVTETDASPDTDLPYGSATFTYRSYP